LDQQQPSLEFTREEGQPSGEGAHSARYRSADEVVVGINLQMNGIGADFRIEDFEVELAERVKRFLADVGDALRKRDRDLLLLSTIVMAALVVAVNRSVWRPLYRLAQTRYKLEG